MLFILSVLKFVVLALIIAFAALIGFLMVKASRFRPKINISPALAAFKAFRPADEQSAKITDDFEIIKKKCEETMKKAGSDKENDLRLCIIEADNLVDEILIRHGHPGKDMGERLKSVRSSDMPSERLNELWEAHKIRNKVAHESDFHISNQEAKKTIDVYKKVLNDLISK